MKTVQEHKNVQCTMSDVQWKNVKLGNCLSIGNGCDYKHLKEGDIPVFGTGGIMTYVDKYLYDGETVCIGRKGTINHPMYHIGKIWTVDTLFYTHSFVDVIPKFIYYAFCNIDWSKYNEATGVPSLSKETIYKIEIPVPDLSAQRRIAAILSSADKVIASTQKLIAKYKQMKQGMMEELFNEQCTMNNVQWRKVRLGEVGEIISGGTPSTTNETFWDGDVLFVTPLDLGRKNKIDSTLRTISELGVKNSSANKIKAHSLAISTRAPIGLMSIVNQDFTTNQGCKSIQFYDSYDSEFFYYYLSYNVEKIQRYGQGTTFMEISKTDFSNLEFTVPDLSAQRRIAAILSGIDAKIAAEEKVLEKYEKVKKGLLERLLEE